VTERDSVIEIQSRSLIINLYVGNVRILMLDSKWSRVIRREQRVVHKYIYFDVERLGLRWKGVNPIHLLSNIPTLPFPTYHCWPTTLLRLSYTLALVLLTRYINACLLNHMIPWLWFGRVL